MMQPLREYQRLAVSNVLSAWKSGARATLLCCPTGGGKTRLGEELVRRARAHDKRVLWIAHRRELIRQAADRLRLTFRLEVALIAPGEEYNPLAPIQVATVQTLLAREERPPADLVVFDEAHHYAADDWRELATAYQGARSLGLTATPERGDGKPLGDLFDSLVVAASYSELIAQGHLVQCRVYQPPEHVEGLAQDPFVAYQRYGEGGRAFVFCRSVEAAYDLAEQFRAQAIPAQTVEADTPKGERDQHLEDFAAGRVRILTNVYALTEGVDVPAARVCILARGCDHVTPFLQMAGRVLRPDPDKPDAILIDLTGATLRHGMPTEDRIYSLSDEGIQRTSPTPLRNCLQCGACVPSWQRVCPACGYEEPVRVQPGPRIYDMELRAVFAGAATPEDAKAREYRRLRALQRERGFALYFVQKAYKQLFGVLPVITDATDEERRAEFQRLSDIARERGYKPGYVLIQYKTTFGAWPPRIWRAA